MPKYRLYADGGVIHEDDWVEVDTMNPVYDDYSVHDVPDEIVAHIEEEVSHA